jgi:hypothetical protein
MSSRSRYGDHTIPKKTGGRGNQSQRTAGNVYTTIGRLIDYGTHIKLVSNRGADWTSDRVTWVSGSFGFGADGVERSPRLWTYDDAGKPIVEGDMLVIDFLDGDSQSPIVRGGVRSIKPLDEFFVRPAIGADANRFAARLAAVDDEGAVTGHVEVEGLLDGNNLEIRVGGSTLSGARLRIRIDDDAGTISHGKGAEVHPAGLGDVQVQALMDLATDIIAVNTAIPTLTPVPAPTLKSTQILVDAAQSLAAGAPMLSSIVMVE